MRITFKIDLSNEVLMIGTWDTKVNVRGTPRRRWRFVRNGYNSFETVVSGFVGFYSAPKKILVRSVVIIFIFVTLQGKNDKLIADYYKKIKKSAGTKAAAQFYQIEGYILSKIRSTIMENIPLIGELEKK